MKITIELTEALEINRFVNLFLKDENDEEKFTSVTCTGMSATDVIEEQSSPAPKPEALKEPPAPTDEVESTEDDEIDVNGEVWNPEIHATSKSKNKDGSWRLKRGMGSVKGSVPPPPDQDAPADFVGIMQLIAEKGLSLMEASEIAQKFGYNSIALVASHPESFQEIYDAIAAK